MRDKGHYSTLEVARLLGIKEHRLAYAHRTGTIPEPMHVAGKRIYSSSDVERIAQYFGIERKKERTWSDT